MSLVFYSNKKPSGVSRRRKDSWAWSTKKWVIITNLNCNLIKKYETCNKHVSTTYIEVKEFNYKTRVTTYYSHVLITNNYKIEKGRKKTSSTTNILNNILPTGETIDQLRPWLTTTLTTNCMALLSCRYIQQIHHN